jgi:hypothetical protein
MTEEEMIDYLYENVKLKDLESRILESGMIEDTISSADGRQVEGSCRHAVRTRIRQIGDKRFETQGTIVLHPSATLAQVRLIANKEQVYTKTKWTSYGEAKDLRVIMDMHGYNTHDAYVRLGGFHSHRDVGVLLNALELVETAEIVVGETIDKNALFQHYHTLTKTPSMAKYLLDQNNRQDFRWLIKAINLGKFKCWRNLNMKHLLGKGSIKGILLDNALKEQVMLFDSDHVIEEMKKLDEPQEAVLSLLNKANTLLGCKIKEANGTKRGPKRLAVKNETMEAAEANVVESMTIQCFRLMAKWGKKDTLRKIFSSLSPQQ